jgi:murein DD-endopeptidase MepM/ murein hydrolase activator NlpD
MAKTKYSYNPKTLKYERVGVRWGSLLFGVLSGLAFTALFFVTLIFLQAKFFETGAEEKLRLENEALLKHKAIVATELQEAQVALTSLRDKEGDLHRKIFFAEKVVEAPKVDRTEEIMRYNLDDFRALTQELLAKTNKHLTRSALAGNSLSKLFWPGKADIAELQYYPTKTPVKDFKMKQLASGFGNQINPFNKRMYRHNGIDIICERGTEVLATGKGTVIAAVTDLTPGGKGSYVVVEHINGYQTRYAHLSYVVVSHGQKLAQGQAVGMVGSSGSAIAPHLHYEILRNGRVVNPVLFFIEDLSESELYQLAKLSNQVKQSLD